MSMHGEDARGHVAPGQVTPGGAPGGPSGGECGAPEAPPLPMMRGAKPSLMLRNGKLSPAALVRGRLLTTPPSLTLSAASTP